MKQTLPYVLITPARNEESYIEKTIQSMVSQTTLPLQWIIVNDGSIDNTPKIIDRYAQQHSWIKRLDMPAHGDRGFAAKAHCFNQGYSSVKHLDFEVIGNLDADLSFDSDYLEFLLGKFIEMPDLGVAGTVFREEGYDSGTDSFEGENHVAGGCQLFRRKCFEEVGGYVPNHAGGVDWIAVTTARMKGWKTRSFQDKFFFHYRSLGTAERRSLAATFSYGEKDYYLGNHPLWEMLRVTYRLGKRPFITGALALAAGYIWKGLQRSKRPVSDELITFHRHEEMLKLRMILGSFLQLRRIDNFHLMSRTRPPEDVQPKYKSGQSK
ncbi:glycosyltransferase family 2 protein [bacterium]|nr:MAG: glycosyltransferase family 2 protein [bacterium]